MTVLDAISCASNVACRVCFDTNGINPVCVSGKSASCPDKSCRIASQMSCVRVAGTRVVRFNPRRFGAAKRAATGAHEVNPVGVSLVSNDKTIEIKDNFDNKTRLGRPRCETLSCQPLRGKGV